MPFSKGPQPQFFKVSFPAEYVAHVEISRPQKLNAFLPPMWPEMKSIFESLSFDPNVRVVLLSGTGDKGFTAGLDVKDAAGRFMEKHVDPSRKAFSTRDHILDWQGCVSSISSCRKPVVALMHGIVYGAGIDLTTACDIRYCSADATFCIKETDIGLAADLGTLARWPKVVGLTSFAKEAALTAKPFSADVALEQGFVSRVLSDKKELLEEGLKLGVLIASKSPVAVQGTKNILDYAWGRTVEENNNYVAIWNAAMLQSTDFERAVQSGLQKRKPTFEKL